MTTYTAPDSTIYQSLKVTSPTVGRKNVLVVGAQYAIQLNDGREMDHHPFQEAIPLRVKSGGVWSQISEESHEVDTASLKLFAKDLRAPVSEGILAFAKEGTNKLRITQDVIATTPNYGGPEDLNSALDGRAIRVGDYLRIVDDENAVRTRKVVALLPASTSTSYTSTDLGSGVWLSGVGPGTYNGDVSRSYTLEIRQKGSTTFVVRVLDSSGVSPMVDRTVDQNAVVDLIPGSGLNFNLSDELEVGDTYRLNVVAASLSNDVYDGVLLDGPLPPAEDVEVTVYQSYTGELTVAHTSGSSTDPFFFDGDQLLLNMLGLDSSATGADAAFSPFDTSFGYGTVYASFRAIVIPTDDEVVNVSLDTLVDDLGEIHPDNYAAYCAHAALTGVSDSPTPVPCSVFVLRTTGEDPEDFTAALNTVKNVDLYYALVAATKNTATIDTLRAHTLAVSTEKKKLWRKLYTGIDSPGQYAVWGVLPRGTKVQASLHDGVVTIDAEDEGLKSFADDAAVGDLIAMGGLPEPLLITRILSDNEVEVSGSFSSISGGIDLIRTKSPTNTRKFLNARAAQLRSRRVTQVWCDRALDEYGRVIPNMALAAYEAGARVSSLAQLGRTRGAVSIVTSAPTMYSIFDDDDLNEIGSAGTYIITQASPGGAVYVRHQLTTETTKGALYAEDNITAIVDAYSFEFKDVVNAYIGSRNNTQWAYSDLQTELRALTTSFTTVEKQYSVYGPMIVTFFDENGVEGEVTVRRDTVLADHAFTYVKLRVPIPINGTISYIDVDIFYPVALAA